MEGHIATNDAKAAIGGTSDEQDAKDEPASAWDPPQTLTQ